MKKNTGGQVVVAQLISKTDGSPITTGTTTVYVLGDGGTQFLGSPGPATATHEGNGVWSYPPEQGETNFDHIAFTFVNSSAINATVQIYTSYPQTGDNYARLGAPAGASMSADVAAVKAETASILTDTAEIGAAGAGLTVLATAANLATVAGYIDTEISDIQSRLPAALVSGRMDANVGAMAANVMTAAAAAADLTTELQAGLSTLDAAGVRTAVGLASANLDTQLSAIDAVTDKLNTTLESTGSPGQYVFTDEALAQAPSGTGASAIAIADEVQTRTIAAVTTVNGLAANTVTAAVLAADAVAEINAVWTTAMTESYATDGATMTPTQALYMLWSLLAERSIVSTTLTAKKLDGSTTAMTFTLDSATTPTSQTRAT